MMKPFGLLLVLCLGLAACASVPEVKYGSDGKPLPRVYRLRGSQLGEIQLRMLDSVNTLRSAASVGPLRLNAALNAAAATHSQDMSLQNRPWHFGSDGSSPIDRVARAGYVDELKGELISETYETELETLAAWAGTPVERSILLDPAAQEMGFAFFQEPTGKLWWTLVTGGPESISTTFPAR